MPAYGGLTKDLNNMNYQQLAHIIKIKNEFHNSTVAQDLADYKETGKVIDPKTTEVSQEFVIPSPNKNERQDDYVNRCMKAIGGEYDTPAQAVAVCYTQWKNKDK